MSVTIESAKGSYTLSELMVVAAAREIKDGEVVFVGMRLPLIAFVVAKKTHAPNAVGLFENGVIRSTPSPELIYTMADPPNIKGATQCLAMSDVMSLLQSGRVHLGFLGAAEVDRYGNLNSAPRHERHDSPTRIGWGMRYRQSGPAFCRSAGARAASPAGSRGLHYQPWQRGWSWVEEESRVAPWRACGCDHHKMRVSVRR